MVYRKLGWCFCFQPSLRVSYYVLLSSSFWYHVTPTKSLRDSFLFIRPHCLWLHTHRAFFWVGWLQRMFLSEEFPQLFIRLFFLACESSSLKHVIFEQISDFSIQTVESADLRVEQRGFGGVGGVIFTLYPISFWYGQCQMVDPFKQSFAMTGKRKLAIHQYIYIYIYIYSKLIGI